MNTFTTDLTSGGASSSSMPHPYTYPHQRWTNSHPDHPSDIDHDISAPHEADREDMMCVEEGSSQVETRYHRWNPASLHIHVHDAEFEDDRPVEWVPLSDDEDEDGDIQDSGMKTPLSPLLWYHSRIPGMSSASTSFDSLGLHHPTPSPVAVDTTHYNRTSFLSNSTGMLQPELSELDLTQISPLSGSALLNWHSPPGISYYTTTMREDEFESLLGRKRPRDGESDDSDMVNGCKRKRQEWWVAV